ncbi:efflux RND transporter periplasmic adaptor subunit [Fundidesulfovibrio agrisoli]|uniref:efflux RND transporter periplasmic adaptor subunit n=1 Tax=Fundidesulfovibrio agrisoli TaxID=2922717 RepID=UPI001FAD0BFA|nr:HlyD family efflux transporter periplasmic adaptor subunit [Fundidesulfovibrio agrisoli]
MKKRHIILPVLAAVGLAVAVAASLKAQRPYVPAEPVAQPSQAPYSSYIGGAGLVEASSENIALGTSVAGIVSKVHVQAGDTVKDGQPLFTVDERETNSEIALKKANLSKAKAALEEAKASLADYRTQYAIVRNVTDRRAVSVDEVEKRRNAESLAKAKVESAKAAVDAAEADLAASVTTLERLTVRTPLDCQVLQVNIHAGEFAATGSLGTPLMRLGNMDRLQIRVDVDENDAWRPQPGSRATAFMRGNREMKAELDFVRVEPYVTPKTSLTGSSTERVDTRVLQVVYAFERSALRAFVGQQMDVFIETPPRESMAQGSPRQTGSGS